MNKQKLKDLASQAGFDVKRLMTPQPGGFHREDMLALESFAELIILECADISHKHWEKFKGCSAHFSIREHFGVERREE